MFRILKIDFAGVLINCILSESGCPGFKDVQDFKD
jgi:hypothetical protein